METSKKISLTQCKKTLESEGKKYSDQQIEKIRDMLYTLGELDYLIYNEMRYKEFTPPEENKAA